MSCYDEVNSFYKTLIEDFCNQTGYCTPDKVGSIEQFSCDIYDFVVPDKDFPERDAYFRYDFKRGKVI